MKRIQLYGFIILLAAGFFLTTCQQELSQYDRISTEIEIEPQLVAPLIYGSVTMSEITELFDSVEYIGEFEDNLIYFAYSDTLISVSADTAMALQDTIQSEVIYLESDSDVILPIAPGDTADPIMRTTELEIILDGDNRLDELLIKGGSIGIDITSTFRHKGILKISSQQILDDSGNPFSQTIQIDVASGDYEYSGIIDTEGYTIKPTVVNDTNLLKVDFEFQIINSGLPILSGQYCSIQFSLNSPAFYHIYGFLDTQDLLKESGSLDIPLWEDNPDLKAITFADPRIEITSSSSMGIPFEIDLDSLIAIGSDGEEVFLTLNDGNTLKFLAPGIDQEGETVVTNIKINNTTSNIDDFLAVAPSRITYSIEGRTSTTGDDTTHFVLDESKLDLTLDLLMPLDFKSTGFALIDTMEFSLVDEAVDTSMIRNAELSITTDNELPVELMLQILLLDRRYNVVAKVFDDQEPILGASVVNEQTGKLIQSTLETNTIEFPAEKLGKLDQVAYMQVRARLTTSAEGGPFVKIYSYYTLDFEISMLANFRINSQ
jgi:hypothetical protein